MLRTNSRPLFLLLLILLFVVAPVMAAPNLTATIEHRGNASANNVDFLVNSTDGIIRVNLQNTGADPTTTDTTLTITLGGGLVYAGGAVTSTPLGLFTSCTGTNIVTCTTSTPIPSGADETIRFPVTAPNTTGSGFTNSLSVNAGPNLTDPRSFAIVTPIDLVITGVSHTGNAPDNHIFINTNTGRVTVTLQNQGTITSSGLATLTVRLEGGLTFFQQVAGSLFNNCSGTTSDPTTHISTVTCTTSANIAPGDGDTVTFTVNSPSFLIYDNNNSAVLSGGGDPSPSLANDPANFSVVATGTLTPTVGAGTFTPFPTFPSLTGVPGGATAVVTPTLIPPLPTRTPLPRPANAGQAIGPIPRPGVTVVVDRDGVNVRLLPALGAEVIATVNAGFSTDILARSPDNEWVQVQINGELGWIGTAVLAIVSGDLNAAPVADPRTIPYGGFENPRAGLTSVTSQITGKLQNSGLRVRGGPSRSYPVLANAPRYTIFSLLGRSADNLWVQVNFEGTLGWVAAQFVEFQQGGALDQLPIDGIVADALPISEPTADNLTDTLKLMLARVELAQPSLDAIRSTWTSIALGERAQCGSYPARPSNLNIPNPVLAPFYATLFPLNTDFNSAMTSLRQAIDLLIDICSRAQPAAGFVGQPVVQQALDAINAADAQFVSLRQRLIALLPPEGPINNETECLFTFNDRSQVVPRLRPGEAQLVRMTARNFVLGFCFDGGAGQSLSLQALRVSGNAEPRLTVSAFDNPTNFIGTGQISPEVRNAIIQPILITQTGRYLVILADLDGAPNGTLDGEIALLLTDITSGGGGVVLAIDPVTGNVIITQNPLTPLNPGFGLTPGIPSTINLTPGAAACPSTTATCEQLASCTQAIACLQQGNTTLDGDGDGVPCENLCGGG